MPGISKRAGVRRTLAGLAVAALSLLAAACIFAPGKFTSQLDLRKDRSFAFRYTGEILMAPLMESKKDSTFTPEACHGEETYDERDCTPEEIAQQKAEWESQRESKKKSDAQAAQMLLGGMDPSNPESGNELAAKLRRQAGWNKVEYLGNGKFDVDFAISGKLDHDFVFPTMEGFPMSNAFVQVMLRQDGSVRIDAPGFGPPSGGGAMAGMMSGMPKSDDSDDGPTAMADGTFTVLTDAQVLANNTDEGPQAAPGGAALSWTVNPRSKIAPMALLKTER
ncbi:hypothetical protein [Novosphingobium mangrovi (ex Huang et al. 2023)]|uniref:Lipoprotein n=1 Tax=Novosphingobium mangrovi (ex Huang et al. 2023) TaxID=2976432 RepID=A0ABT2I711_9SPHN|nr:hypothetical protein [Novosphingobium mangrovi (ex Huang et al. 2023)]MCT2400606.1 hypothetical protein [Novosphingobium mangrovi (ex Huang et al. 2023)]